MAQLALPPGAVRKRAVFGLLDADGWTWATIKAAFWFVFIIFVLGYVPDRAYYFTVSPTIDLGFNAISPINLCPADNQNVALPGAGRRDPPVAGQPDRAEPAAGSDRSGHLLVRDEPVPNRRRQRWRRDDERPGHDRQQRQPQTMAGRPCTARCALRCGGPDAERRALRGRWHGRIRQPDLDRLQGHGQSRRLTGWADAGINLPVPLTDASGVATANGLYVFGGRPTGDALVATTYQHGPRRHGHAPARSRGRR